MSGYRFEKQVVLITGAAGGVGRALCADFCERGATVLALDVDEQSVQQLADELGAACKPVVASVTDLTMMKAALDPILEETGPVDILVNNAGAAAATSLSNMTPEAWRHDIDLNLTGAYHCVEVVKESMLARGAGVIINIGTVNALQALGHPGYSAAKAGLISYTKSVATEYGPRGIRANMINPGTVKTDAWKARVAAKPDIFEKLKKWYPLRNFAEPSDIAAATAFLASSDARVITGAVLPVDGGLTAGNPVLASELTLEEF